MKEMDVEKYLLFERSETSWRDDKNVWSLVLHKSDWKATKGSPDTLGIHTVRLVQ